MNKTAIKNFAVWARQKLISDITYKAGMLGITEDGIADKLPHSTSDLEFYDIGTKDYAEVSGKEIKQRNALVNAIRKKEKENGDYKSALGYVVEEVAYTWFNRLIAIRFMEVNDYLPSGVRVLSSENKAKKEPDLVTTPFDTDLEFTSYEQDRIIQLKDDNKLDELFRMLFIKQCNKLHDVLPELFEKTDDYTELLLTVSFTDSDGVLYHLVHDIEEDDFNVEKEGQVQIIGWLYQFYNTELKDDTFAQLKKKFKITKERIPAATQLFTPDWIVRYMVENSLGRLWLEGHPNAKLHDSWKYYLDEARQEQSVEVQLQALRAEYKTIKPEEIKVIDPCMGSGHILVYAFDVLMQIYLECGYTEREAVSLILQNNLFGLDIDDRAYQLAYFAVMMKARQYDRRFLTRGIQPNLYSIRESNGIQTMTVEYFHKNDPKLKADMESIITEMRDAKEYGSILNITPVDFAGLYARFDEISNDFSIQRESVKNQLLPLVKCAEVLAQKYDVVVTNPPYMGYSGFDAKLVSFAKYNYPNSKSDMSTMFMEQTLRMCTPIGYMAMINIPVWMFITSYEQLRKEIITQRTIIDLLHPGRGIFGSDFGSVSFVIRSKSIQNYKAVYNRLFNEPVEVKSPEIREQQFLSGKGTFLAKQETFLQIPGCPISYWVSDSIYRAFVNMPSLGEIGATKTGMTTGDNNRFLRLWYEIAKDKVGSKYEFYSKGSDFRRWYCSVSNVILWENNGDEVKNFKGSTIRNEESFFKKCIVWNLITSGAFSARAVFRHKCVMGDASPAAYVCEDDYLYTLACLNSKPVQQFLNIINPTINCSSGVLSVMPIAQSSSEAKTTINEKTNASVNLSIADWDSLETSWDFKRNPLV